MHAHTILRVVVGSRACGLDTPGSDHDRRGVFAAPTGEIPLGMRPHPDRPLRIERGEIP